MMLKKNSYLYHRTTSDENKISENQQSIWTYVLNSLASARENIREIAKIIIQHPLFDQFILSIIMINCTFMIMSDYDHVDHMNNLSPNGSIRNQIILNSEIYFTAIFTCEFVLKWAAMNIYGPNSYFHDSWNWLDFLVVVTSLVALAPSIPSIKVLRTFRVLRPLKSLRSLPAVAEIVEVFVASILKMGDIFGLIMFSYLFFAVIGLQIFSGPYMHTRCRLTPFPVTLSFQNMVFDANTTVEAFESYRCLNASNVDYPGQSPVYTKASSPWSTPHPECYWPVDINDQQLCTLSGNSNVHVCQHGYDTNLPISQWRWCGSSYDALGNDRFGGNATMMDNYLPQNGYGWINFDNFGLSVLTVIQSASGDSWSSIQYEIFDCFGVLAGAIFFNVIILVCLIFLQQLIIAILEDMFSQKMKKKIEKTNRHLNLANKALNFIKRGSSKLDVYKTEFEMRNSTQRVSSSPSLKEDDIEANKTSQVDDSLPVVTESLETKNPRPSMARNNSVDSAGSNQSKNITQQQLSRSNSSEISDRSAANNSVSAGRPLLGRQPSTRSIASSETGKAIVQAIISFINKYDKPQKNAFRRGCRALAESFLFQQFFSLIIMVNTAMFAYDHYPMRQSISDGFDAVSFILTLLFTAELLINLLGFGLVESFSTWFSCFDFAIVFVSVLDISLSPIPVLLSNTRPKIAKKSSLTALRSFRLFRLLRFFKSPTLKEVVRKIMEVVNSMGNFLVLLLLFHIILALIGMQFFANRFRFDAQGMVITEINSDAWINAPDRPRSNFDNFSLAVASIFQMVTIDNWSVIMFNAYRAFGPFAILFPLFVYLSGSVLLMNLFLALLIRNFSDDEGEDTSDSKSNGSNSNSNSLSNSPQLQSKLQSPMPLRPILTRFSSVLSVNSTKSSDEAFLQDYCSKIYCCCCLSCVFESPFYISMATGIEPYRKYLKTICGGDTSKSGDENVGAWIFEGFILMIILLSCILLIIDSPLADPNSNTTSVLNAMDISITVIFSTEMLLKMFAFGLYGSKDAYFADGWNILDCFVVAVSIFSVITADNPSLQSLGSLRALRALRPLKLVNRLPGLRVIVQALFGAATEIMNIAILVFFVFFIFSIFFTSFLKGQLRSCGGDVFDNVIATNSSYMDLLTYPVEWNSMTPLQQSWFGVNSPFLNASSPSPYIISTTYVNSTAVLDCNSVGNCCSNWNFLDVDAEPPNSRQICECWGGGWYPVTDWRYDNVAQALMTLFVDGTVDNWTDNMHDVSDSNGVDMQPIRDNQIYWIYVYCAFTLIGNYFCLQLFIGSITANFEKSRRKLGGLTGMTKAQQEWVLTRKIMTAIKPKLRSVRPKSIFFGFLYDVTMHWMFESFIIAIIILQCTVLSMTYFGQDDTYGDTLDVLEITMTTIFAFEMVMKLISLTYKVYFQDVWNRVDCLIVLCSVAVLLNSVITGAGNQAIVNVVRVVRVARLLRVLKSLESLQILLDTVAFTIPGVINVSLLVLLTVYIFSVICVQLFAKVAYNNSYYEDANFRTFGIAFTVLYRFLTGDNWGQFVVDLTHNTPDCVNNPPYNSSYCGFNDQPGCIPLNGCGSIVAYPVLVIFMLFTTLVLLSVFISIIISNYSAVKESPIKTTEFSLFAEHWSQFDPHATRFIPYSLLFPLVSTMFQPFGFEGNVCSRRQYGKRVGWVKVSKDKRVFFDDVLAALSKAHFERNAKWAAGEVFEFKEKKSKSLIQLNTRRFSDAALSTLGRLSPKRNLQRTKSVYISTDSPLDSEEFTVSHYLAVDLISEAWERRKKSRLLNVTIGSYFCSRNLHALSENEELRNNVSNFIRLKEEKAAPRSSFTKRISIKLRNISSRGSINGATPDSKDSSMNDLYSSTSDGSLKILSLTTEKIQEKKFSSVHGQEERVSYSDDRVAPTAAISGRFSFPIDESAEVALSEERFSPISNDDTGSSIIEEKEEESDLTIDDYRPFQRLNMETTPLPNPTFLQFSPPSNGHRDSVDSANTKGHSSHAKRYVSIDSLLGNANELGLYSSPIFDYRRVSSPGALGGVEDGSYMDTASSVELKYANLMAPIFDLGDFVISSGRSKSLPVDGRRLADNFNSSPDRASYLSSPRSDQKGAEDFASPESFVATIDKYYQVARGEPFQSGSSEVTYRVNPQQLEVFNAAAAPPPQPPPSQTSDPDQAPLSTPPSYSSTTPKGDKIREISVMFEKFKSSSSPPWHTPSSQSLTFDLEGGMDTKHTGQQKNDREFQSTDMNSATANASSRSKASQDRVKKLAALFEIDSSMLSSSSSSSIVMVKK